MSAPRLIVVGAGIVGTHCALQLRSRRPDAQVMLIDRAPFAYDGASACNMGGFATCEVQPLASVGNLFRAAGWMLDPLAPFTLRPRWLPDYLPWLRAFIRSALTPGHFEHVVQAQRALMAHAHEAHLSAIAGTGIGQLINDEGALVVYRTRRRMERDWHGRWQLFREQGETCRRIERHELRQRLPDLAPGFEHAVHVPAIRHWHSPAELLRRLHGLAGERGISILAAEVTGIEREANRASALRLSGGGRLACDQLVIAAGAWSGRLCAELGEPVPLDSERGYATTLPEAGLRISQLLLFPDDEFVATPMLEGLRIGGTVELAGLHAPPNFGRTDALVTLMRRYFPTLEPAGRDAWMGHRPSMPDGLPVIGLSRTAVNVAHAFGHGHVGVTQSAITGRLVAQALCGLPTDIPLAPYSIARFAKGA